jgi:hypothetical protein
MTTKEKQHSTEDSTLRRQVAALPFRVSELGSIEILLITSRDTGRFIIPKGWRKKGQKQWDAAAREAFKLTRRPSYRRALFNFGNRLVGSLGNKKGRATPTFLQPLPVHPWSMAR